jgi:hypothetical protein
LEEMMSRSEVWNLTEEESEELLQRLMKRKWYSNAVRGIRFLRRRYENEEFSQVKTSKLKWVCGVNLHKEWSGVLTLMRDILELWGLDLVNTFWGEGYTIAHRPEQTLREIIKSQLRAFNHIGSAGRRKRVFEKNLEKLGPGGMRVLVKAEAIMAIMGGTASAGRKQLMEALEQLDEVESESLNGIAGDVERPVEKLLDLGEDRRKTLNAILGDIRERIGEDDEEKAPEG